MLTSVRYSHEQGNFVWPIPFPYGNDAQVGVTLLDPAGLPKRLAPDRDYHIQDRSVIYILAPEHSLEIFLDAPLDEAIRANAARTLARPAGLAATEYLASLAAQNDPAPAAVQAQTPACDPAPSTQTTPDPRIAELAAKVASLENGREQALVAARLAEADDNVAKVREAGATAVSEIDEKTAQAGAAIRKTQAEAAATLSEATANVDAAARKLESAKAQADEGALKVAATTASAIAELERKVAGLEERLAACAHANEKIVMAASETAIEANSARIADSAGAAQTAAQSAGDSVQEAAGYAQSAGRSASDAQNSAASSRLSAADSRSYAQKAESFASDAIAAQGKTARLADSVGSESAAAAAQIRSAAQNAQTQIDAAHRHAAECAEATIAAAGEKAERLIASGAECLNSMLETGKKLAQAEADRASSNANDAAKSAAQSTDAAFQASVIAQGIRPGIAAVKSLAELEHVVSGMYLINPYLAQTPTMFYGVWCVNDFADAKWDGVFFTGGAVWDGAGPNGPPKPEDPKPVCPCETCPDACPDFCPLKPKPEEPAPEPQPANGVWGPCKHTHINCA